MEKLIAVFVFVLSVNFCLAQETRGDLRLGQWKSHLPYTKGVSVTQNDEKVFFATDQSIFTVEKSDHSVQLHNKISGLSDAGMGKIKYYEDPENPENDALLITYQNSNIDILRKNGTIINLKDIERKPITGDKRINHIFFDDQFAWLSCGFGIVKLDMVKAELPLTTFTDFPVYSINIYQGEIYASTESGLYKALNDENTVNLTDFGQWEKLGSGVGLPDTYFSKTSAVFKGKFYAGVDQALYVYDGTDWNFFYENPDYTIENIFVAPNFLQADMASSGRSVIVLIAPSGNETLIYNEELTGLNTESILDENGNFWVADEFEGNSYFVIGEPVKKFDLDGPYRIDVGAITASEGEIWTASINLEPKWNFKLKGFGFGSFIDNEWSSYLEPSLNEEVYDLNSIAVHPETRNVYVGSFNKGLIAYDRENYVLYDATNSSLREPDNFPGSCRVSGLAFDQSNNLWISNYLSSSPINVLTNEGEWLAFSPTSVTQLTDVIVDDSGYKWFATNNSGLLIYDSGADLMSTTDDRYARLTSSNSSLETNEILSIQKDLDGFIWVGTDEGVFLFDCPSLVFDNACAGRRPIAQEGGINDLLLATESINAIAVDGANRKWFGTNNGLFVLETDADEAEFIFNTENSPLFDNNILALAIEGNTGEVFIGTEKGIISYRSNATDGGNFFKKDEVYAFPNPVRPDYDGEIAIKGLVTDSNVKITDVGGRLIYETTALGGQAVWNGYDYDGNRAATGVYLVFMTSKDGLEKMATKILIVN